MREDTISDICFKCNVNLISI